MRSAKRTNTAYVKNRLHTNVLAHGVGICNLFRSTWLSRLIIAGQPATASNVTPFPNLNLVQKSDTGK